MPEDLPYLYGFWSVAIAVLWLGVPCWLAFCALQMILVELLDRRRNR
jgi:hypothetical protein